MPAGPKIKEIGCTAAFTAGNHLESKSCRTASFEVAGLLLSVQNQWFENDAGSMPEWFASTSTLPTFPLGLRYGVKDPFALAWHRHALQERRTANLLQSLAPLDAGVVIDLQKVWQNVEEARDKFSAIRSGADAPPVNFALQRLLQTK